MEPSNDQPDLRRMPVFRTTVAGGTARPVPRPGPDVGSRGVELRPGSGGRGLPSGEVRAVRCCETCKRWNTDKRGEVGLCGLAESRDFRKTAIGMIYGANPWTYGWEGEGCRMWKVKR